MKLLRLTSGNFAQVDDEDYERLLPFTWSEGRFAVSRTAGRVNKEYAKNWQTIHIPLAREVMQQYDIMFDHKDRNKLNNQKNNLRETNNTLNARNVPKKEGCSSKYRGVSRTKYGLWRAAIKYNRKQLVIGSFKDEIEAAKAYDKKAIELYGEWAMANFPEVTNVQ